MTKYTCGAWAKRLLVGLASGLALATLTASAQAAPKSSSHSDDSASSSSHGKGSKKTHAKKSESKSVKKAQPAKGKSKGHKATAKAEKPATKKPEKAEKPEKTGKTAEKSGKSDKLPALSKPQGQDNDSLFNDKPASKPRHGKTAQSSSSGQTRRQLTAEEQEAENAKNRCLRESVEISRGAGEVEHFALTRCDGKPAPNAVEKLSLLLRPYSVPRPEKLSDLDGSKAEETEAGEGEVLPGIRRADAGLVSRIQAIANEYPGRKITIVSGYRPGSTGSYHKLAKAVDLKIEGVRNDRLVTFCRSLVDTGCGFYPNSSFIHLDVRPRGTGHVYWIDAASAGEGARFVKTWPAGDDSEVISRPDHAAPSDENTHPDAKR